MKEKLWLWLVCESAEQVGVVLPPESRGAKGLHNWDVKDVE